MSVVSKNTFALLGDGDSPAAPAPAKKEAPKATPTARGNEGAFRDKNAGRQANRNKGTEGAEPRRTRGARGARGPHKDDRHSKSVGGPGEKQADKAWGATEGNAELKDELAGQEIAAAEKADEEVAAAAEPEEVKKTYEDFLAEKAKKQAALESNLTIRQANEGSKTDKKWESAKALTKEESDYLPPASSKSVRQRERKVKETIIIEPKFVDNTPRQETRGPRGGRGGPRGGPRGGGPRGGRGGASAPRPAKSANINTSDESAFPSLGA